MSSNSITQGNTAGSQKGFFRTALGSLVNVGATIGAGAAVGGGIGKLASLTPYKPKTAELEFQLKDMFERAVSTSKAPDYMKNTGDEFAKLFKEGRKAHITNSINQAVLTKRDKLGQLAQYVEMQDANLITKIRKHIPSKGKIQAAVKEVLKNKSTEELTQEEMMKGLENKFERLMKFIEKRKPSNLDEISTKFAKKAFSNERMTELATKGAKHMRNKAIIGVGIGIGIIGALVLNVLKTYGVLKLPKLGKNQTQQNALPNGVSPEMVAKLQQIQTAQGTPQAAK